MVIDTRFKWVFDKNELNGSLVSGFTCSRWVETQPRAFALGLSDYCDVFLTIWCIIDLWCSIVMFVCPWLCLEDPCGRLVSRPTPPRGLFGSVWLKGASRDLLVSGVTPVLCFGLILTRVDLVTQPVTYLVFGYIVTCRFIIVVIVVVVMF